MNLTLKTFHDQFSLDIDTITNRQRYRAVIGVKSMHMFCGITIIIRDLELVGDKNTLDDQDIVLFFDLAFDFRGQVPVASRNAARFQRATKGSSQSATRRGDNVIKCGCPGFGHLRRNIVVFGDFGMHPKVNRTFNRREVSAPVRPFYPFDANFRSVYNLIAHALTLCLSFVYRAGSIQCPSQFTLYLY